MNKKQQNIDRYRKLKIDKMIAYQLEQNMYRLKARNRQIDRYRKDRQIVDSLYTIIRVESVWIKSKKQIDRQIQKRQIDRQLVYYQQGRKCMD